MRPVARADVVVCIHDGDAVRARPRQQSADRPGVRCELRVQIYGPATLPKEAQEVKRADTYGHCSWTWKVPDDVVPGTWRYRVIVGEGESSSSRETPIVIT